MNIGVRSAPGLAEIEGEAIRRNIIPYKVATAYYKQEMIKPTEKPKEMDKGLRGERRWF